MAADQPRSKEERLPGPLRHLALFLAFVGLPVLWTVANPVSYVRLERDDAGSVTAHVRICLLLVVPFRLERIAQVRGVSTQLSDGSVHRSSATGATRTLVHGEDSAFLVLEGASRAVRLEISPASVGRATIKAQRFLDDPRQQRLRLFLVANWKFSIFAGALLSLLTLFYVWLLSVMAVRTWRGRSS